METEDEWQFVNDWIQRITVPGHDEWHIGLKKQGLGTWQWVNGGQLKIEKWQLGKPSGDGNKTAMAKNYPPGGYLMIIMAYLPGLLFVNCL